MVKTVADQFSETLAIAGAKRVYGVVGDSLNGLTDAIGRQGKIESAEKVIKKWSWHSGRSLHREGNDFSEGLIASKGPNRRHSPSLGNADQATITALVTLSLGHSTMTKISRSILLAASLLVVSTAGTLAQSASGGDTATTDSKRTPADTAGPKGIPAYSNPNVPGATGDTIVRGDDSTLAGDRAATKDWKSGQE
jgi:hypothetical protein